MRDRLLNQASREYGPSQRLAVLVPAGLLFVVILPLTILSLGRRLDRLLRRPPRRSIKGANAITGGLLVLGGWLLGIWANYVQFTEGRGTPVPVMATQKLITRPPYSYCRNPMALGAIIAYQGVSLIAGSLGAALLVALWSAKLLIYIKALEEREMVARFGEAYEDYRRRVPFLLPRLRH